MNMKEIKKAFLVGRYEISDHAIERLEKRGYMEADVKSCILSGEIRERQTYFHKPAVLITGEDLDGLPIVTVVGVHVKKADHFNVITVMPPIDKERFDRVI